MESVIHSSSNPQKIVAITVVLNKLFEQCSKFSVNDDGSYSVVGGQIAQDQFNKLKKLFSDI